MASYDGRDNGVAPTLDSKRNGVEHSVDCKTNAVAPFHDGTTNASAPFKCCYEDALDNAGFGRHTFAMLMTCCMLILAMYLDIFGFSVTLPAAACDLDLTASQQALLSAIPLIGVMISSYAWGLCADTLGRRSTLLGAMTVGVVLNLAASMAPNYVSLAVFKFFSAGFTASANAAAFVLLGETTPRRHRNQFMFLMASATMLVQFLICIFALPIFQLTFRVEISWLAMEYRPWRLLLQIISLPGAVGVLSLWMLQESPKFLLSKGKDEEALEVLRNMHAGNCGGKKSYPVSMVYLEEAPATVSPGTSFLRHMWNQTAPLFKPPLLKNNAKLYFILMCAYMTSTGYTMWVPTMTNAFFNEDTSNTGQTFCEVASTAVSSSNNTETDCDNVVQTSTLYAVMCYSGASGTLNILLSFIVGALGRRRTTLLVFSISAASGLALLFVRVPLLSIALFYIFLYVALILGNVNSYLVELNPTHLRGMATCLSVVVARGFGFFSVQIIARLLTDYCTPMISGYVALVAIGGMVSFFLPLDMKKAAVNASLSNLETIERIQRSNHDAKMRL